MTINMNAMVVLCLLCTLFVCHVTPHALRSPRDRGNETKLNSTSPANEKSSAIMPTTYSATETTTNYSSTVGQNASSTANVSTQTDVSTPEVTGVPSDSESNSTRRTTSKIQTSTTSQLTTSSVSPTTQPEELMTTVDTDIEVKTEPTKISTAPEKSTAKVVTTKQPTKAVKTTQSTKTKTEESSSTVEPSTTADSNGGSFFNIFKDHDTVKTVAVPVIFSILGVFFIAGIACWARKCHKKNRRRQRFRLLRHEDKSPNANMTLLDDSSEDEF